MSEFKRIKEKNEDLETPPTVPHRVPENALEILKQLLHEEEMTKLFHLMTCGGKNEDKKSR